jgi:N-acetylglucosaminyl-diphospho-decaprenol L-rhamnosyltransferase
MRQPAISAIVVAWNSEDALTECIGSLRASASASETPLEIVVIDNGSSDASLQAARELRADIVISNPVNAGYGVAAAQGLARATAPWALLVNPDVVVERAFVDALAAAAESSTEDVATLVPDVRFSSDRAIVNCRGIEVDDAGIPAEVEAGMRATNVQGLREVFGGSSGTCLLRVDAVHRVCGIEPAFFAYIEDVDLAWQLRRAGYRAVFVPAAIALHEGSASLGADSPIKAFLVARNRRLLFRLDAPHTARARLWRAIVELGHASVVTASGGGLAPWLGRFDALRLRPYTRFVRRSRSLIPAVVDPETAPRASLGAMLRRKRAARHAMSSDERCA